MTQNSVYPKKLLFIITGGTLDSEARSDPENPPITSSPLDISLAKQEIHALMSYKGWEEGKDYDILLWKADDSRKFSDHDMKRLAAIIDTAAADKIIVTHGTDWMIRNALRVKRWGEVSSKTIVFTGAMVPLANGAVSDGSGNLEDAIKATEIMALNRPEGGRYIALDGEIHDLIHARKNHKLKRFESPNAITL